MTDLRQQIAEAVHFAHGAHYGCAHCTRTADAVLTVVQPVLAAKDAEIARLRVAWQSARQGRRSARLLSGELHRIIREQRRRAEQAEAANAAKDDEIMRLRLAQNVAAVLARYRQRQAHAKLLAARKVQMANADARREDYVWLTREQGLTLAQAADRLGITERTAERYEAAARRALAQPDQEGTT